MCFTAIVYHQTKILKILNNANVPNYLYNKTIDWAIKGQMSNIRWTNPSFKRDKTSITSKSTIQSKKKVTFKCIFGFLMIFFFK